MNEFKALRKSLRKTMKSYDDPILAEQFTLLIGTLRNVEKDPKSAFLRKSMARQLAQLVPLLATAKRAKVRANIRIVARNG